MSVEIKRSGRLYSVRRIAQRSGGHDDDGDATLENYSMDFSRRRDLY